MKERTVVVYHKSDMDGVFCYQIAKKFLGTENVTYIGWEYGDMPPAVPDDMKLYILDLSIEKLMDHPKLVWIDHHKSAIEKYGDSHKTIDGFRIDGVAACRLTWQWFDCRLQETRLYPDKADFIERCVREPLAVRLAGEYDIWDKRDPDAELFQNGLRSRELGETMWELMLVNESHQDGKDDIGSACVMALLDAGEAIQYAKTQENKSIIESYGFTAQFEGLTFLCCNHARFNSLLFTAGIKPEHDALLGFNYAGNNKWRVSLYHAPGKEHHDLSEIAKRWRGGGHKGACGFTVNSIDDIGLNI